MAAEVLTLETYACNHLAKDKILMSSLALFINATLINTTVQKKLSSKLKE